MRRMTAYPRRRARAYPVYHVSVKAAVADLVAKSRADVATHGGLVLIGRRGRQTTKLRRLMAALRTNGYSAHYRTDGALHLLEVGPFGPQPRTVGWWGMAD
jgi:hypothetical protein